MIYFLDLENWDGKTSRENISLCGKYKFKDLEYISCTLEDQDGTQWVEEAVPRGKMSQIATITPLSHSGRI